jgi:hypothetical protein
MFGNNIVSFEDTSIQESVWIDYMYLVLF